MLSYEYDFLTDWKVEVRIERVIEEAPCESHRIPVCVAGREPGPPDGCGGPQVYAEHQAASDDQLPLHTTFTLPGNDDK